MSATDDHAPQETPDRERPRGGGIALAIFVLLVGGLCLAVDPGWGRIPDEIRRVISRVGETKCGLYVAAYASSVLGLALLLVHRNRIVRVLSALVWLVTAILELGLERINGYGYELWEAKLFFAESTVARDAAVTYGSDFLPPLLTAGVSLAALAWFRHAFVGTVRWSRTWLALVLGVVPVAVVVGKTEGLTSAFPSLFKVPVITAMANLPEGVAAVRDEPLLTPKGASVEPHLIFVVDESIRGDLLALHGGGGATTPYLESIRDRFLDFGVASSGANSSAPSNILLQTGLTPEVLLADPGRAETTPNLFQYARRAGLATALFAGQAIKSWYYISPFDLDAIDRYRGCREERPEVPDHLIDDVLIDEVVGWIAERPRTFSYLLKMGAHFPYAEKHPADFRPFDAGRFASESDPRRRQKLTEYCLAMSRGCDRFLERLLTRLEGTDAIVVYTSDHGQSILEGGIEATHGVYRNPPRSQANVPIMIFATSEAARRRLDERGRVAVEANRDRASHFELFATFLELMGYDRAAVAPHYGSSLFAPLPLRKRRFFSGDPFQRQGRALNDFD